MKGCYLDTSALAKWYINEPGSQAFEDFVRPLEEAVVSRLTAVELRCLLARRRRMGEIDPSYEGEAYSRFEHDVATGHLSLRPSRDAHFVEAINIMERLSPLALRTLDAIHLALTLDSGVELLATADKIMAEAATELGITVKFFGEAS